MFASNKEPITDHTPADVRALFADKHTEQDLADAYAIASNSLLWVEDEEYDYEEGTQEYTEACRITDEWGSLMDYYMEKIFSILSGEGITIPETGQIHVLLPFMARNGYIDETGWWMKRDDSNEQS